MALLIVTTAPTHAGTRCEAHQRGTPIAVSVIDSHGKARLNLPERGRYVIRYAGTTRRVTHTGRNQSADRVEGLTRDDDDYLTWLEMSTTQKLEAIDNNDPIARWAAKYGDQ